MNPTQKEVEEALAEAETPFVPGNNLEQVVARFKAAPVLAAAYRQLEAQMPRTWDAKTIKDAPEGAYQVEWLYKSSENRWQEYPSMRKSDCVWYFEREGISRAFGPIPQPGAQPPAEGG